MCSDVILYKTVYFKQGEEINGDMYLKYNCLVLGDIIL